MLKDFETLEKMVKEYEKLKEGIKLLQEVYTLGVMYNRNIYTEKKYEESARNLEWKIEDYFS